jgi:hypothetical protein
MVGGAILTNNPETLLRIKLLIRGRIKNNINPYVEANQLNIRNAIYYGQLPPIAEFPIFTTDPLQNNMDKNWRKTLETNILENYKKFFNYNPDGRDFREQLLLVENRQLLMRMSGLILATFPTQEIILVDYENYFIRYINEYGGTEDTALINLINKLGKLDNHINIICKRELTLTRFNLMINELKHNNYSISCIFAESYNAHETLIYPKSTRSFDDCTFILIFKYLLPMFPNTIYFSDDKRLFTDFNTERRLLLPYNITIISTLNPYIINKAIINPIEDEFYNTDLTQAQLHDYNHPDRGFLNDRLIY